MLAHINIHQLLYIDIETVPEYASFSDQRPLMQDLWRTKHATFKTDMETAEESYYIKGGIFAEFSKIVCISIGIFYFDKSDNKRKFRVKSVYGDDEKKLLGDFLALLEKIAVSSEPYHFCGHNICEFDIPFLCRRLLINNYILPEILDHSGKKPWQMLDVDTLQLWKFGDYKSYTSLKLIAEVLGIPTPKDDIDGKDVRRVYWEEKNLPRIVEYCQKDVVTVARLLLRFKGDPHPLNNEDVTIVS